MNKIIAQATGDFPFQFYIEKAVPVEEDGKLFVEGIASTTNVDHDQERMSEHALKQMATIINKETVPLRIEHQKTSDAIVGNVYKAWIDSRNQLWIRAALDKTNPIAQLLHKSLTEGVKLGLSVGGRVKRATRELVESIGKKVNTFFDIVIDEVSVTQRPANYDAWLFAKSYAKPGDSLGDYYSSQIYNQFLFENPQLDYIRVFEKSIPDQAWETVEKEVNKMNLRKQTVAETSPTTAKDVDEPKTIAPDPEVAVKQEVVPEEATKDVDETRATEDVTVKRYASVGALKSLEKTMTVGFLKLIKLMKQVAPQPVTEETTKDETPAETVVGGQVSAVKQEVVSDETTKQEVLPEEATKDETVPTAEETIKQALEEMETTKQDALAEMETTKQGVLDALETTKDEAPVPEEATKEEVLADETTKQTYGTDYEMPAPLKSAMKSIDVLTARLSKRQVGYYHTVAKSTPTIDQFVEAVSGALHAITKRMEHDGKRILGLEQSVVDMIRNDSGLQKSIKEMMDEPGPKRSVAMGIPYMVTKDGKKYALTANEVGVEKSVKPTGNFKDVYKSQFSTEATGER